MLLFKGSAFDAVAGQALVEMKILSSQISNVSLFNGQ
jgi:hypothetical protein